MHWNSIVGAVTALALTVSASPLLPDKRQVPTPVPPYVAQGVAIYKCTKANTVALTFDDGLTALSTATLNRLQGAGMKATFFLNGDNWGKLRDHVPILQRMLSQGHQVGSHT
jgi:peptidoglycan/xylan/chitin deacetylase (PgdA/CDA1 family)